ncbi:NUDIX hydrolase [Mobilicoccus massiliensis]|uniref:NUDIX hydrolase n=1 Tax=Mobilicoccus massiliensis TaxID=1522310 RepID=UPI0009E266D2|nr:NUDIX hydrolase [Mobilicoccus massiliensis]
MSDERSVVLAAGTLPWRRRAGELEVALVHRPRHDDWAWPKGKLEPDEEWPVAAVRETQEETGLRVRLGRPLPTSTYRLEGDGRRHKEVRYWAAQVIGGAGRLENEIDEVRWVTAEEARRLATYPRDLEQLDALVDGPLPTRAIAVVRHAHAVARKRWKGDDDRLRPLDEAGEQRASALVDILAAYAFPRVVCSPSTRCVDTVAPYLALAEAAGYEIETSWRPELSEEGYEEDPAAVAPTVTGALGGSEPVLLCSHGPVLRPLIAEIVRRYGRSAPEVARILDDVNDDNLAKGEALVLHVGTGPEPALIAVERHLP